MSNLQEIGVAGYLDEEAEARLADLDVDAVHSIGISGPWTPELLLQVHEVGADKVADFVHTLPCMGPMDPDDLSDLLDIGIEKVQAAVRGNGSQALESDEIVRVARASR